ncbi:MAG: tetratricopeptide repeat protein [Planctomycetota bacterium]
MYPSSLTVIQRSFFLVGLMLCFPALLIGQESEGQADLNKAYSLKTKVESTKDLDAVVRLCESAIEKGLDEKGEADAKLLAAAALYEHADLLAKRISPTDPTKRDRRWRILRSQAINRLKKATKLQPELLDAYMLSARLNSLPGGNRDAAMKAIEKAIELTEEDKPEQSKAYFMRALLQTDEEKQLDDLVGAIAADPSNLDAVRVRAAYYLRKQQPEKAVEDLSTWLDSDPAVTRNTISVVRQLMDLGPRFDDSLQTEAIKFIDKALEKDPKSVDLFIVRAQLQVYAEKIDEAISDATKAIEINPKSVQALMIRASMYSDQQQLDKAFDDVTQVLKIRPLTESAVRLRGIILSQQGKFDAAIDDFVLLSNSDRENTFYRRQLAMLYNANDEPSKAVRIYNNLLRSNTQDEWEDQPDEIKLILMRQRASTLRGRGDARLSKGSHEDAIEDYEEALEIQVSIRDLEKKLELDVSPADDGVLNNLAWVLATSPKDDVRDGEAALKYATEAAEVTKFQQAHILSTLASAYAEQGDFENAIKYIKDAIEVNRKESEGAVDKIANEEQRQSLQLEFESYQKKKPWRELEDVELAKKEKEKQEIAKSKTKKGTEEGSDKEDSQEKDSKGKEPKEEKPKEEKPKEEELKEEEPKEKDGSEKTPEASPKKNDSKKEGSEKEDSKSDDPKKEKSEKEDN